MRVPAEDSQTEHSRFLAPPLLVVIDSNTLYHSVLHNLAAHIRTNKQRRSSLTFVLLLLSTVGDIRDNGSALEWDAEQERSKYVLVAQHCPFILAFLYCRYRYVVRAIKISGYYTE
jgi:hypothetical protein